MAPRRYCQLDATADILRAAGLVGRRGGWSADGQSVNGDSWCCDRPGQLVVKSLLLLRETVRVHWCSLEFADGP